MIFVAVIFLAVFTFSEKRSCAMTLEGKRSSFEYEYRVLERIIFLENQNRETEKKQESLERRNEELIDIIKKQRLETQRIVEELDTGLTNKINQTVNEQSLTLQSMLEQFNENHTSTVQKLRSDIEEKHKLQDEVQQQMKLDLETRDRGQDDDILKLETSLTTKLADINSEQSLTLQSMLEQFNDNHTSTVQKLRSDIEEKHKLQDEVQQQMKQDLEAKDRSQDDVQQQLKLDLEAKDRNQDENVRRLETSLTTKITEITSEQSVTLQSKLDQFNDDQTSARQRLISDMEEKDKLQDAVQQQMKQDLEAKDRSQDENVRRLETSLTTKITEITSEQNLTLQSKLELFNDDQTSARQKLRRDMEEKDKLRDEVQQQMKQDLEAKDRSQDEDILRLETTLTTKIADIISGMSANRSNVFFTARIHRGRKYNIADTIVFGDIVSNEGGAYDAGTGVFTAPRKGVYLFSVTAMVSNVYAYVYIKKNSDTIGYMVGDARRSGSGDSVRDTTSVTVVVELAEGDTVYALSGGGSGSLDSIYTAFTGALLY